MDSKCTFVESKTIWNGSDDDEAKPPKMRENLNLNQARKSGGFDYD